MRASGQVLPLEILAAGKGECLLCPFEAWLLFGLPMGIKTAKHTSEDSVWSPLHQVQAKEGIGLPPVKTSSSTNQ